MNGSLIAIVAIVVVAVGALAVWLIAVGRAARKPYQEPHGNKLYGPVQGGLHVGGGRSVAPRRDEAVDPDHLPTGDTAHPRLAGTEPEPESEPAHRGPANPTDQ